MSGFPPGWRTTRAILAIEALGPIFQRIGVIRGEAIVRSAVRTAYAPHAGVPLSDERLHEDWSRVLHAITTQAGVAEARRFSVWTQGLFFGIHSQQPALSAWNEAFRAWSRPKRLPGELRLPPNLQEIVTVITDADRSAQSEAEEAVNNALANRLSDMDLSVLAAEQWLGSEHPATEIGFAAGMRAFEAGWRQLVDPLPFPVKERLRALGRAVLADRGIDLGELNAPVVREVTTCL